MSHPLVSIIMPMKNASRWVKETIQSIQQQSFTNWELIIIDDDSSDDSCTIVTQLATNDSRIYLSKSKGNGIIFALQQALEATSGEFLTRMDADDCMPPTRLALMVDFLQLQPALTIVTGKVEYFSEHTVSNGYRSYQNWLNERVENQDFYDHIYRECIVASPNWMGRTEEFKSHQLFENLSYPEDYDLCFHWQNKHFQIKGLEATTLFWREHPLRTSRNSENYQQKKFFELKMKWFAENFKHAKSVGIVGMGTKGKLCVANLLYRHIAISLYDLNHQQFSTPIEGCIVQPVSEIKDEIILIARYPNNLKEVQLFIESKGYIIGKTAFWV